MRRILFILSLCLLFSACAKNANLQTTNSSIESSIENELESEFSAFEVYDPLQGYNRFMSGFNQNLYLYAIRPVLIGYNAVTPELFRSALRNFFSNLAFPLRFTSNFLQLKFDKAGIELKRFIANTTLGFGGLRDVGSKIGLNKQLGDIGTAFGNWGIKPGFHLVLPLLGPSNLRDTIALPLDWFLNPSAYLDNTWTEIAINAAAMGNELSFSVDEYTHILKTSPDVYLFLRDAYEQRRNELIK